MSIYLSESTAGPRDWGRLYDSYGTFRLTKTSPPQVFTEPLSLSEIKDYLRITDTSPVDAAQDITIAAILSAARAEAERVQKRNLIVKSETAFYDYWPNLRIQLRDPLISVDSFTYIDNNNQLFTMVEGVDYRIDRNKALPIVSPTYNRYYPSFTPEPSSAIQIAITSGFTPSDPWWSNDGAAVKQGIKMLCSHWFDNRLPIYKGPGSVDEYPYTVSLLLEHGKLEYVK